MMGSMRRFLPFLLPILLVSCVSLGPELQPQVRAWDEDWIVSLHAAGPDRWTVAVWHPGPFALAQEPVRTALVDESVSPSTSSSESRMETLTLESVETQVGPLTVVGTETVRRGRILSSSTRTTWEVGRARWQEGRPFQLRVKRGLAPLTAERTAVLEVTLGPEPGQAQGLKLKVLETH